MWEYSRGDTKRIEKLYLYLTRKARRRVEQSCSCQEELQRNEASDEGFRPWWEQRENISKVNTSLTERECERG